MAAPMEPAKPKDNLPHNVLQEFLEAIAEPEERPGKRKWKALTSYAELQYKTRGGGRCAICRSSVRHVLPVTVEHTDGSVVQHDGLCTRCLEAEKAQAKKVTIKVGNTSLEYTAEERKGPKTKKFRAYTE
jgi:hypothetical protein